MSLAEQVAAATLAQRVINAKGYGEAEFLAQTAHKLDPSIKAEDLINQWLEQWLEQTNKNRNGEPSQ